MSYERSETTHEERRLMLLRIEQGIYLVFGVVEVLIAIRFALRLLGANPGAAFADFIYSVTAPFIGPFVGLFGTPEFDRAVFEPHALVAIVVYALLAWLLVRILWLVFGGRTL